jgi:hypothetical protein
MLYLSRAPHSDRGSVPFLANEPIGALSPLSHRIRVALEHDERGGARRMCRGEQRRCRERAGAREQDRFATS